MKKATRASAVLAAGVWSVALLIFLFPPLVITQAPPVTPAVGAPEQLLCPGMVKGPPFQIAADELGVPAISVYLNLSPTENGGIANYCLLPGGNLTIYNWGPAVEINDYTGYGAYNTCPGFGGSLNATSSLTQISIYPPFDGVTKCNTLNATILSNGQSLTIYPAHSGYITFIEAGAPEIFAVIGVVIAQPTPVGYPHPG